MEQYAEQETRKVTLGQLMAFGRFMNQWKLLKSANYVKHELAVRIGTSRPRHIARIAHVFMDFFLCKAHRIRDFQHLPFIVGTNPRVEKVYDLYCNAFDTLRQWPEIKDLRENFEFCQVRVTTSILFYGVRGLISMCDDRN